MRSRCTTQLRRQRRPGGFKDQVTAALLGTLNVEVGSSWADARSTGVTDAAGQAADKVLRTIIVCAVSKIAIAIDKRFKFTV
jgi:hypothetical protein